MIEYSPFSPVDIRFTTKDGAIDILDGLFSHTQKTLVLMSKGMGSRLELEQWINNKQSSFVCLRISDVPTNPTVLDIANILKYMNGFIPDRIIAIGGGSCIDLAKIISALRGVIAFGEVLSDDIRNAIKNKVYYKNHNFIDIIALPTTSGTGSEVTKWATVWDMERKEKLSVDYIELFPKMAILVPELTLSMPKRLTLSTGLDALSHAMEAFWAKNRTHLSQVLALSSITLIHKYLPQVLSNDKDLNARKEMCLASLLAGLAFSITRTTACHSISYPLTMNFGIEHGLASAMTLVQVAARNEPAVPEIENIYHIFGGKTYFEQWLINTAAPVINLNLRFFGVTENDVDTIVEGTFTKGRIDNNPVAFSAVEVKQILLEAL